MLFPAFTKDQENESRGALLTHTEFAGTIQGNFQFMARCGNFLRLMTTETSIEF